MLGQPHAIEIVSRAIQTAGAHLSSESRPLGTFLFVGSSAVGKTKLAQSIAELVFGSKKAVTFIPMGQYQEKHNVSNLTGVPPGYVGSEEEGYLTRILRKNPQGVLIFDEAEKAHACFWDLLLTICDEGYYKDTSTGRKVDCRNVFVILTSNLGSRDFLQNLDSALSRREEGKRSHASREPSLETLCSIESVRETFLPAVKRFFRPEFLGRVKVIPFVPLLDPKLLITIATAHLEQEKAYLASGRHKLQLTWDEDMTHYLGLLGKDPSVGVRPIRDCLERDMRGLLSELILSGKVRAGNTVQYTLDHSEQPTLRIVEL